MKKNILCFGLLALIYSSFGTIFSLHTFECDEIRRRKIEEAKFLIQELKAGNMDPSTVIFRDLEIEEKDLPAAYLKGVTFKNCYLKGYDLEKLDLREIVFENVLFVDSVFFGAILWKNFSYSYGGHKDHESIIVLRKIYSNLLLKGDQYLTPENYNLALKYYKQAENFYQILHAIGLSHTIESLTKELTKMTLYYINLLRFTCDHYGTSYYTKRKYKTFDWDIKQKRQKTIKKYIP